MKEGASTDEDDDVDGVEVFLASEAASEIGLRIGSGVELIAAGAKEPEESFAMFAWEPEGICDHVVYGELISEVVKLGWWDWCHRRPTFSWYGRENGTLCAGLTAL